MDIVRSIRKLTPEERRKALRKEMFRELRAMEMERRERADLEELQRCGRENEESAKETESLKLQKERAEEERRANKKKALDIEKQDQLKEDRLQWKKVMQVEEEPITRSRSPIGDLKREQQGRHEEAELCLVPRVQDKAGSKYLTAEVKRQEQSRRNTLIDNWVGEQTTEPQTVQEELHPTDFTHRPAAENASLKSESMYLICIHLYQTAFFPYLMLHISPCSSPLFL